MSDLTPTVLRRLWPRAPQAKIDAIARVAPSLFDQWQINTPLRVAHLMAQISHENGAGTISRENMNYRAERIMEIFGVGRHSAAVTADEAQRLAHNPRDLAERVYGLGNPKKAKELGNTRPGDGFNCRGGGDLQLTGAGNYRRIGALVGVDLYANPTQLEDPAIAFQVAVIEFAKLGCLKPADNDDVLGVTLKVNGGRNGLPERRMWLRKWKDALDVEPNEAVQFASIPEPQEPRAGETDAAKKATDSTIIKGAAGGGGLGIGAMLYQAWEAVSSAPENLVDATIKLAQKPGFWFALAVVALFAFIFRQRLRKIIREGI